MILATSALARGSKAFEERRHPSFIVLLVGTPAHVPERPHLGACPRKIYSSLVADRPLKYFVTR